MPYRVVKNFEKEKEILSRNKLMKIVTYNPHTGVFEHTRLRREVGWMKEGYRRIKIDYKNYYAHRLAWLFMTGKFPDGEIDHINRVTDDNRWINLREATHSENQQNVSLPRSDNKSGFLGVNQIGSRYRAVICLNGKRTHLGMHPTAEEAHEAYIDAKRKLHKYGGI